MRHVLGSTMGPQTELLCSDQNELFLGANPENNGKATARMVPQTKRHFSKLSPYRLAPAAQSLPKQPAAQPTPIVNVPSDSYYRNLRVDSHSSPLWHSDFRDCASSSKKSEENACEKQAPRGQLACAFAFRERFSPGRTGSHHHRRPSRPRCRHPCPGRRQPLRPC